MWHGLVLEIRMRSLSGGAVSVPLQGQIPVNLCIPLSSLLMTCAYVRTIERRREIFILCSESGMRITVSEEQENRERVVAYAQRIYPGARIFERTDRLSRRNATGG